MKSPMPNGIMLILCCIWIVIDRPSFAQLSFEYVQQVPVIQGNDTLTLPWAGGINSGLYNTLDLNNDEQKDLVIFDRTSAKVMTFLQSNGKYVSQPLYASLLPEIRNWLLFIDYNHDGRKDLFTGSGSQGIRVYLNTTEEEGPLRWKLVADPLRTLGFSGNPVSLQIGPADTPGISDTDGDGDLDIMIYNINGNGGLNYYENQSIERYGHSDSLEFTATERRWGGVQECGCNQFVFGTQTCEEVYGRAARMYDVQKEQHVGGKSVLLIDIDHDGDKDLITGHEDCTSLYFMENIGSASVPRFEGYTDQVPQNAVPVNFSIYPAPFYEDLDLDGVKDLMVTPNVSYNVADQIDFRASNWFYKNNGSDSLPSFSLVSQSFLQDEMIDVGENASPALIDFDQDGDLDLFVGSRGTLHNDGFYASIMLYENVGDANNPVFALATEDFAQASQLKLQNLKVYFHDLNGDGLPEMIVTGSQAGARQGSMYIIENTPTRPFQFEAALARTNSFSFASRDNFAFYDINSDGQADILLGKETGDLAYYQNEGNGLAPRWVLNSHHVGDIMPNISNLYLSPLLYDLDQNGTPELISTDIGGKVLIRSDFVRNFSASSVIRADTAMVVDSVLGRQPVQLGEQTWLAAANLFGDNSVALLIGEQGGGITLLKVTAAGDTPSTHAPLLIYPNPSFFQDQQVKIQALEPIQSIQVISLAGQVVHEQIWAEARQQVTLQCMLPVGMYLVRAILANGSVQTGKLILANTKQ